jgi:hypothetical protein
MARKQPPARPQRGAPGRSRCLGGRLLVAEKRSAKVGARSAHQALYSPALFERNGRRP